MHVLPDVTIAIVMAMVYYPAYKDAKWGVVVGVPWLFTVEQRELHVLTIVDYKTISS